jgi:hypothetical protein
MVRYAGRHGCYLCITDLSIWCLRANLARSSVSFSSRYTLTHKSGSIFQSNFGTNLSTAVNNRVAVYKTASVISRGESGQISNFGESSSAIGCGFFQKIFDYCTVVEVSACKLMDYLCPLLVN